MPKTAAHSVKVRAVTSKQGALVMSPASSKRAFASAVGSPPCGHAPSTIAAGWVLARCRLSLRESEAVVCRCVDVVAIGSGGRFRGKPIAATSRSCGWPPSVPSCSQCKRPRTLTAGTMLIVWLAAVGPELLAVQAATDLDRRHNADFDKSRGQRRYPSQARRWGSALRFPTQRSELSATDSPDR
jgi:hypothetical protein